MKNFLVFIALFLFCSSANPDADTVADAQIDNNSDAQLQIEDTIDYLLGDWDPTENELKNFLGDDRKDNDINSVLESDDHISPQQRVVSIENLKDILPPQSVSSEEKIENAAQTLVDLKESLNDEKKEKKRPIIQDVMDSTKKFKLTPRVRNHKTSLDLNLII